jgi:DNA methylase
MSDRLSRIIEADLAHDRAVLDGAPPEVERALARKTMMAMTAPSDDGAKIIGQTIRDRYAMYHGDVVNVVKGIPTNSLHFACSSWPFVSLYSYTDAIEDFSNIRTRDEFFKGIDFMLSELARIMMPGRLVATHCMNLPLTIEHDGVIGIYDFRGDIIRAYEKHGFVYHSEVVIYKDPLIAATRTHALGLAHKQIVKDSAMCRMGIPDYLVVMRKRGVNPEPIAHGPSGFDRWIGPKEREPRVERSKNPALNKYSHLVWQNYAAPVWFDINPSDTLQRTSARDEDDSKHVCPLQLTVIRRAIELWSNRGDVVFDPFTGIGSTGYVALQEGRRFVGSELKDTYYRQSVKNLEFAANQANSQTSIFDLDATTGADATEEQMAALVASAADECGMGDAYAASGDPSVWTPTDDAEGKLY